jgi:hypothetical protein
VSKAVTLFFASSVAFRYNPFTTKVGAKQDLVGKKTQCKGGQKQHKREATWFVFMQSKTWLCLTIP